MHTHNYTHTHNTFSHITNLIVLLEHLRVKCFVREHRCILRVLITNITEPLLSFKSHLCSTVDTD